MVQTGATHVASHQGCFFLHTSSPVQEDNQGLRPANERRRYFVTPPLIGWAQA